MNFDQHFTALTGHKPFPWQEALFDRFLTGNIPDQCDLPTGLGKTSVIAVWLIALAHRPESMPRRLVYVVNRRTVVDQTTDEVVRLRERIGELGADNPLKRVVGTLGISTLRGQFADNREWSADPARPAVIVGTVDMIGSRLLFSGYGLGFRTRPMHAGLLGQDAFLVHDEAHLEPAFQELIVAIQQEQHRCAEFGKFRVMALSATSRNGGEAFGLTAEEKEGRVEEVRKRIEAPKAVRLHSVEDEKKLAESIANLALKFKDSGRSILIYLRTVVDVEKVVKKLPKGCAEQLTGTLRGKERDELVRKPNFRRFLPNGEDGDNTAYLVCTSAGEVGVNLSADHLVCDLSTFDSMAQRFGRVNRFGDRQDTEIHVVHPSRFEGEELDKRRELTLTLIKKLKGDASPKALSGLSADERTAAFSPAPTILPATDILFDSWSLTTIREKLPGRPPVAPYLHGVSEWDPPETFVAWREEVGLISGTLLDLYDPTELLEDYPLKPHELLRDRGDRVLDRLKGLKAAADTPVWIIASDSAVRTATLGDLATMPKGALNDKTVVLPPSAGGLVNGMLDADSLEADDVADEWRDQANRQRRIRVWKDDSDYHEKIAGMRLIREIHIQDTDDEDAKGRTWCWFERPAAAENEGSKAARGAVRLDVHTDDVVRHVKGIVDHLGLRDELRNATLLAAKLHDAGKRRRVFQRILRNPDPQTPWAKSARPSWTDETYRHEFGSLLDADGNPEFQSLSDEMKELVLHLIAAHHGRARPHFAAEEAFDPQSKGKDVVQVATEVPRRFARLQRKYGRWGLAYLESLLRAADYAASAEPSATVEETR